MRSVVNDTGKKNDEKQIGEMEKVFTKNALYTQNISKKTGFYFTFRKKVKVICLSVFKIDSKIQFRRNKFLIL